MDGFIAPLPDKVYQSPELMADMVVVPDLADDFTPAFDSEEESARGSVKSFPKKCRRFFWSKAVPAHAAKKKFAVSGYFS